MPITPFHFGPGALLQSVAPRYVSFLSFCAANVVIDLESLYNLVYRHRPIHAFLHTYIGATLVVALVALLFLACNRLARKLWLPNIFYWRSLTSKQISIGAALGAYTHIVLDSIMHQDIRPLSPFSSSNQLLGVIPLAVLHLACLALGLVGVLVVIIRRFVAGGENAR